ncbi:MAG: hypothetical protein GEU80_00610 [Dehalococcoidia bacterium]|nr:hypothetical protein [Dehalococcoidia bacterium]
MGEALASPLRGVRVLQRAAAAALLLLSGCAVLFGALAFLWPESPVTTTTLHDLPVAANEVRAFEVDGIRGWLVRQEDGSIDAFWAFSPFLGCFIDYVRPGTQRATDYGVTAPGAFLDTCFGGQWSIEGVPDGVRPTIIGLSRFVTDSHGGWIEIDLGQVQNGECARNSPSCPRFRSPGRIVGGPARTGRRAGMYGP